ncbi:MAG: hypothetical protein R3F11_26295 [Verrucomicrobiales bacterium]
MFVVTHALSPVAGIAAADALRLEATGERLFRREHYIAFALSGALPDVLCPHLSLAARYASWSHTFWALCLFAAIALPAARFLFGSRRWLLAGSLMVFAYAFHLGCDAVAYWHYGTTVQRPSAQSAVGALRLLDLAGHRIHRRRGNARLVAAAPGAGEGGPPRRVAESRGRRHLSDPPENPDCLAGGFRLGCDPENNTDPNCREPLPRRSHA